MDEAPAAGPATTADWPDLVAELDRWGESGRTATLWWRDDDAAEACAALDDLLDLAGGVPLGLAVIPASATPALAERLAAEPRVRVLQHGWRHRNHNTPAGRKSEFPGSRSAAFAAEDLAAGHERLDRLFGSRALPVLVPPWNRFDPVLLPLLARCGIAAISTIKPRSIAPIDGVAGGIIRVNVHVDLVAWRSGRGFVGTAGALGGLVGHLRARRLGLVDDSEPTGLLTHHLVSDAATTGFLERLLARVERHPAATWTDPSEIFTSREIVAI
jgi:hypothetical protein